MKSKIIISLILTVFIAVIALCVMHTAMMMAPMIADNCVLSANQSMCPLQLTSSWRDLFVALPQINFMAALLLLLSVVFLVFFNSEQSHGNNLLKSARIYSKTYPNFSSLNFLSHMFSRGILHPKIF